MNWAGVDHKSATPGADNSIAIINEKVTWDRRQAVTMEDSCQLSDIST